MGKLVRPVFGQPCYDCGEQIPQARVRILEADAAVMGHPFLKMNILCTNCTTMREVHLRQARLAERPQDTVIVRGR